MRNLVQAYRQRQLLRFLFWILVLSGLVLLQQIAEIDGADRLSKGLQNAAHGPWFGLVTWVLWRLNNEISEKWRGGLPRLVATALVAVFFAFLSEFLQMFSARDASVWDLFFDFCGAAAVLALIHRQQVLMQGPSTPATRTRAQILFAMAMLLLTQYPLMQAMYVLTWQKIYAPRLLAFDSRTEYLGLRSKDTIEVIAAPDDWQQYTGRKVLMVDLGQRQWPGISLDEPLADWSGYHTLQIDLYNPSVHPLVLHVSVRPRSLSGSGTENFHQSFRVASGGDRLLVNLDDLLPERRSMHWEVRYLVLYSTRAYAGRRIYFGEVRLR